MAAINSCEFSMSIAALANTIACKLSDDDLDLVALAVAHLGETLETIALQRAICRRALKEENGEEDSVLLARREYFGYYDEESARD